MTTEFNFGDQDYLRKLNELANVGMPRVLTDADDEDSAPIDVVANRQMKFNDNGRCADVRGSVTITFHADCVRDGWGMFINVISGTATINPVAFAGVSFVDGTTSKTVAAGNAAFISSDGSDFRIFRMTAT